MGRVGETVEYGIMGIGLTIFLCIIFGFAPSLMLSLSIADTFGNWTVDDEIKTEDLTEQYKEGSILRSVYENLYGDKWREKIAIHIKLNEDTPGSGIKTWTTTKDGWASWIFFISFGVLAAVQMTLQTNIRQTWGIVLVWWLLSIYPFLNWFCWFYTSFGETPFPGINWMPW